MVFTVPIICTKLLRKILYIQNGKRNLHVQKTGFPLFYTRDSVQKERQKEMTNKNNHLYVKFS